MKSLIILLIVLSIGFNFFYSIGTRATATFTATKTERVLHNDSSKYMVFTDTEVYENTDSLLNWKWNSSDIYATLLPHHTYQAEVYGFRIPFFSTYRNILSVKDITTNS